MAKKPSTRRFEPRAPSVAALAVSPLLILGVLMATLVIPARVGWKWPPWIGLTAIGVVVAGILLLALWITRFARRIAKTDGFLCLNCHYDLHGLPDAGECPECGEAYERARLERLWNSWLQDQTKNQKSLRPRLEDRQSVELPAARGPGLIYLTALPVVLLGAITLGAIALAKAGLLPWWAATPMWVALPSLAIWNARRVARFQSRLKATGNMLCLRCRSELSPAGEAEAVCTRCGGRFPVQELRRRWDEYLKN